MLLNFFFFKKKSVLYSIIISMKKIYFITGNAIHLKLQQNHLLLQSFFEKLKKEGFNFEGINFGDSLLKACTKIRELEQLDDSFLDFYIDKLLFIRDSRFISKLKREGVTYKVLKINDEMNSDESTPNSNIEHVKKIEQSLNKEFVDFVNENKSCFEILDVSVKELESKFSEISNFFSELKKN